MHELKNGYRQCGKCKSVANKKDKGRKKSKKLNKYVYVVTVFVQIFMLGLINYSFNSLITLDLVNLSFHFII